MMIPYAKLAERNRYAKIRSMVTLYYLNNAVIEWEPYYNFFNLWRNTNPTIKKIYTMCFW